MRKGWVAASLAAVLVTGCSDGGGGPSTAQPPTSTTADPTTAGPTTSEPAESPSPTVYAISGPCCAGLELDEEPHLSPPWFRMPFTVDVPAGWFAWTDAREELLVLGDGHTNPIDHLDRYMAIFVVDDAEAVVEQARSTPKAGIGPDEEFTAGELSGTGFDARARANAEPPEDDGIAPGTIQIPAIDELFAGFFWTESPEAAFRVWAVDRGDQDLLIYLEAPSTEFDAFAATAEEFLSRIVFEG
jgi:hypothetical protein